VRGDLAQASLNLGVSALEEPPPPIGEVVADATSILRIVVALHETTGHETVHDSGDARPAHGELLGQRRRRLLTLAQENQDAVLGKGQVDAGDRYLDLTGKPGDYPARMLRWFDGHIIRIPNYILGSHTTQRAGRRSISSS
jgi:hypothetical protein